MGQIKNIKLHIVTDIKLYLKQAPKMVNQDPWEILSEEHPWVFDVWRGVEYVILVLVFVLNIALLLTYTFFMKTTNKEIVSNIQLVFQSCVDVLIGIVLLLMLLPDAEENEVINIAWDFLFNYLVYLSILLLLLQSIDRLLNAKYPLQRMKHATWRNAVSIDGLLLLLCLVPAVTRHALPKDKKGVFDYVTSGIVIFLVLVIFCLLAVSYLVARKKPMSSSTSTSTASLVSTI